jgi:ABC-type branched-subunit amino acid transport system substrate-binding protein
LFKKTLILLLSLVMVFTFAGCKDDGGTTQTTSPTTTPADINLGVVMDLTGALSGIGSSLVDSIKLAVDQTNSAGGINGAQVKLFVEDGKTDPTAGFEAIKKLVTLNGCKVIIGPMISGAVLAAGQWAADNKVLLISPSATSPAITNQAWRQYFIRTAPSDTLQGKAMAQLIIDAGYKNVAIVVQNTQYGVGIADTVTTLLAGKATIVSTIKYDATKLDYLSDLQAVKAKNPDVVVHAGYEDDAVIIFKQAAQVGLDSAKWITSEGVKADKTLADAQAAAFMAKVVTGTNPVAPAGNALATTFATQFKAKYNRDPGTYNDTVYDATKLALAAFANVGATDAAKVSTEMLRLGKNYAGVSGSITFDQYGDRTSATFEQWKVVQSGTTYKYEQVKLINS